MMTHNCSRVIFEKNGVRHMRMKFYIQGIRRRGTVHLEVQEVRHNVSMIFLHETFLI